MIIELIKMSYDIIIKNMLNKNSDEMSKDEYCYYGTIKALFKSLTLHGAGNEKVTIPLPFDMKQ